jgi:competence protein ComEA
VPWPGAAQRVLIVLAAGLLVFAAVQGGRTARRTTAVTVADDPSLEVRLDLNGATALDLETLPGVGTALAARIVAYRASRGPFSCVDDLAQVPGFGTKLVESLRPFVTVR